MKVDSFTVDWIAYKNDRCVLWGPCNQLDECTTKVRGKKGNLTPSVIKLRQG